MNFDYITSSWFSMRFSHRKANNCVDHFEIITLYLNYTLRFYLAKILKLKLIYNY